ncbi:serine/threonine-protein kinase [Streptomyces sp. NPDC048304]|uniref:serine/threonine-protein kinase n=1 Tax=Streptomyces sp. NPDC048304 TaxID=3154820 RepID=UPI0033C3C496
MSSGEHGPEQGGNTDQGTGRLLAGRYRVTARLGRGGMGVVWRAVDEVLGREVAVKELRTYTDAAGPELSELRLRMQREARAAARVRHPGVVAVHDVAEVDGRPLIVMELIDGPSLDDVLRERGTLDPYEAARVGAAVADALAAAHRAGVLHRDVKPGNILLDRSGRVVLTDFGIAAMDDPGDGSATRLTRSGELVGSLDYLAPERAQGAEPGPPADVWAVGATLYAAVEGASPFRRESTYSTLTAIVSEPLPEPRRAEPLTPVLRRLMDKRPDARPDAEEAREALAEVAGTRTPDVPTTTLRPTPPTPVAPVAPEATEHGAPSPAPPGFGPAAPDAGGAGQSGAGAPAQPGAGGAGQWGAGVGRPNAGAPAQSGAGSAGQWGAGGAAQSGGEAPAEGGGGAAQPGAGGAAQSGGEAPAQGAGGTGQPNAGAPAQSGVTVPVQPDATVPVQPGATVPVQPGAAGPAGPAAAYAPGAPAAAHGPGAPAAAHRSVAAPGASLASVVSSAGDPGVPTGPVSAFPAGAHTGPMSTPPGSSRRKGRALLAAGAVAVVLAVAGVAVGLVRQEGTPEADSAPAAPRSRAAAATRAGTDWSTRPKKSHGAGTKSAGPSKTARGAAGHTEPSSRASASARESEKPSTSPTPPATSGHTSSPAPACRPVGGGRYDCQVWRTATSYTASGARVGTLNAGTNYFYCQANLDRRETYGRWTNVWWAKTDDDSGNTGVYVSDVYLKGGNNDAPVPGLPVC